MPPLWFGGKRKLAAFEDDTRWVYPVLRLTSAAGGVSLERYEYRSRRPRRMSGSPWQPEFSCDWGYTNQPEYPWVAPPAGNRWTDPLPGWAKACGVDCTLRGWHVGCCSPDRVGWYIVAPHWALLTANASPLALVVLFRIRKNRHLRSRKAGCCACCGYDLRATPDPAGPRFPRCPECGTPSA